MGRSRKRKGLLKQRSRPRWQQGQAPLQIPSNSCLPGWQGGRVGGALTRSCAARPAASLRRTAAARPRHPESQPPAEERAGQRGAA